MNKELKLFIKRILSSLIIIFLIVTFIFFIVRLSPGDPAQKFISPSLSPRLAEQVKESLNLNQPLHMQYLGFLENALQGDFGFSYNFKRSVVSVIADYLPFTLLFVFAGFIFQIAAAFALAIISSKKLNGPFDKVLSQLSLFFYAVPVFVTGVFLIFIFSELLDLFPSSGIKSFDFYELSMIEKLLDYLHHLFLPLITLSLIETAIFYKYLRDNIERIYRSHFVLNLKASGFSEKTILYKHIIPNAINPLITIAGIELGVMLGGTLIVEVIFGLPGMGRLIIESVLARDYPLVIGCSITSAVLILAANLIADILKFKIDKRLLEGSLG